MSNLKLSRPGAMGCQMVQFLSAHIVGPTMCVNLTPAYHHGILNRMFSQETITDVHLYLDCLNFNCCLVGNSNETHLSTLKVL